MRAKYPSKRIFWSRVEIGNLGECWIWKGCMKSKSNPRGMFWYDGTARNASRIAWLFTFGDPGKKYVLHRRFCNNVRCVNPFHLYLGTQGNNMLDRSYCNYQHLNIKEN